MRDLTLEVGHGCLRDCPAGGEGRRVGDRRPIWEDFNLTPVLARAHYEQMARYFADYGHMALQPGELCYLAVAPSEPPGKPIVACRKVQVALELASGEDREVLRDRGLAAMRQGGWLAWPARRRCRAGC